MAQNQMIPDNEFSSDPEAMPSADQMYHNLLNLPGRKNDAGKPRMDLLPPAFLLGISRALEYGEQKYGTKNYERGYSWGRAYAAVQRHLNAFWGGEDKDESGLSHLDHAGAMLAILSELTRLHPDLDSRKKPPVTFQRQPVDY